MPKSIVPSPAAAAAVDRLTLHSTGARDADHGADGVQLIEPAGIFMANVSTCFSEE